MRRLLQPPVPTAGIPTVVPGQFSGVLKPDYVIPFKVSKKEAIEKLKMHIREDLICRNPLRTTTISKRSRAFYVPFWMFDGKASGESIL